MKRLLLVSMLFVAFFATAKDYNTIPNAQQFANKRAPLSFMENKGQITDQHYQPRTDIQFQLKAANGLTIFVGNGTLHYQFAKADKLPEPKKPEDRFDPKKMMEHDSTTYTLYRMDVELIGANKRAKIITEDKQDYYENYYTTGTGENGATVFAYSKITYQDIYPNIDWVLYTKNNELKHEFVVKKGGNPADIKLKYGGATNLARNKDGSLTATTPQGTITEQAPIAYTREGVQVRSSFSLQESILSYEVGDYEGELVIDPSLVWATYYGGNATDWGYSITTNANGNVLISGASNSVSGIASVGAFQTLYNVNTNNGNTIPFIACFNANGNRLWATYYGQNSGNSYCITTDNTGNVYVTGSTFCDTGFATSGVYQTVYGGDSTGYYGDAFIVKFNSTGSRIWATYFGGNRLDVGFGIAVDGSGNVYITGKTQSPNNIATTGSFQTSLSGITYDAFIAKFNSNGSRIWSTYFGSSNFEYGSCLVLDQSGNIYIGGVVENNGYPNISLATVGAYQTSSTMSQSDAFIAKFNTSGVRLWSTYFGGESYDIISGITIDITGNIYITGSTMSYTGISSLGAFQINNATTNGSWGNDDAFIAKFSSSGARLWSTYFGSTNTDRSNGISLDLTGNIYITGETLSSSNIVTTGAYQTNLDGISDAFIAKFSSSGNKLLCTYFGGSDEDYGEAIATNNSGAVYITGNTTSNNNISTSNSFQVNYMGGYQGDVFIAKFNFGSIAIAGNDTTICTGKNAQLGSVSQTNHLYSWTSNPLGFSSAIANPIVSPLVTTTYYLIDSLLGVGSGYDTVVIAVNQLPTINAGADISICAGNSIMLNATSNTTNIVWNNGVVNNQSFIPSVSGNYIATATSTQGCINKDTVVVTVNSLPAVNAGTDQSICAGSSVTLAATGAVNYSWSGGITNNQSFVPTSGGSYVVTGTDANGCSNTDTVFVTLKTPPPTPSITGNYCAGATLSASSVPVGIQSLQWYLNGNLVLTSNANYATNGSTVAGGNGAGSGLNQISAPNGVFVDKYGNVYVCDYGNTRIQKWATGAISGVTVAGGNSIGSLANQFNNPTGVFVDDTGNIYVCDRGNNRVQKWAAGSAFGITVAGGNGQGSSNDKLDNPDGVFVDGAGNVYVSDAYNHRVMKWAPGAVSGTVVAGGNGAGSSNDKLYYPYGVFVDGSGNIYVCDQSNHRIQKWAPGATSGITVAGGNGNGSGAYQLSYPTGVYVDMSGNIFVSDQVNNRIQKWVSGANNGVTVAGNGTSGSSSNQLNHPIGVCVDTLGNVYVSDATNNRVVKWNITAPTNSLINVAGGTYFVTAKDNNGCIATSSSISVNPVPTITASGATSFCVGSNVTLTSSVGTSYLWNTGDTIASIMVNTTGSYYVTTTTNGCSLTSAVMPVTVNNYPTNPVISGNLCSNNTLTVSPVNNIQSLQWSMNGVTVGSLVTATYNPNAVTVAGTGTAGSSADKLYYPFGVFVDGSGNIYIADQTNHRIQKWAPGATSGITVAGGNGNGSGSNQLSYPTGVFVDGNGNIYVADNGNHRIQKWAQGATTGVTIAGGNGAGSNANQIWSPTSLYVDGSGNIFVCDQSNNRVQKWALGSIAGVTVAGGNGAGSAANQLNTPFGVFVDGNGNVYVSDQGNHRIQKWASGAGVGITVAGGNGNGSNANQFSYPAGIYVDGYGNIFVADNSNNRVQKWANGANSGITVSGGNLAGSNANQLGGPIGVFIDGNWALYVCDYYNHRIQKNTTQITNSINASQAGNYTVTVTNSGGCSLTSSPITVKQSPVANITTSGTTVLCNGASVTLISNTSSGNLWNTGDTSTSITLVNSGSYTVTVTDTNGCSTTSSPVVVTTGNYPTVPTISGTSGCTGATLSALPVTGITSLQWNLNGTLVQAATVNYAQPSTVAGGNGAGSSANQLYYPFGVFVDGNGNVYVCDQTNQRIMKWAPGATSGVTVAGGNGAGSGANQLNYPAGVFVDTSGNVYVADNGNHRVQKWSPGATYGITVAGATGSAGSSPLQLWGPIGVFVDGTGNVYVCDNGNNRIQKWAPGASYGNTVAGGNGSGSSANQFNNPRGVFVDGSGNIYVSDASNHRIQKWLSGASSGVTIAGGNGAGSAANQLNNPHGVWVDVLGYIYVSDYSNARIQKWAVGASSGTTVAGGNGGGSAANQLNGPDGVFANNNFEIYISDQNNHRVQKYTTTINNVYNNAQPGLYTVTVSNSSGCSVTSADFTVSTPIVPTITANGVTSFCNGGTVQLTSSTNTNNIWSTGDTTASITVSSTGSYTVNYTNVSGCSSNSLATIVNVLPLPTLPVISGSLCNGSVLYATPINGIQSLQWKLNGNSIMTSSVGNQTTAATAAGGNGGGSAANQLWFPFSVFVDGNGNTYISDQQNHRVQKWTPGATVGITVAGGNGGGGASNQFYYPANIFVDVVGNIYVSDNGNHRVQKWAPGATSGITVAGGNGAGTTATQLYYPTGIYVDGNSTVYVSDEWNHRVQKWTQGATSGITVAGGNSYGSAANQLNNPVGVYVDANSNVYVSDHGNHRIQKWSPGATSGTTVAGGSGSSSANNQLNNPMGLYVDNQNNMYIADNGNNRIVKWAIGNSSGITVAGGNGAGSAANQFDSPTDVFVDNSGNLLVSDQNNHRIQKYSVPLVNSLPITQSGSYTVTATNFSGCSSTSTPHVVNSSISVNAGADQTVCAGSPVVLSGSGALTYTWNNGVVNNQAFIANTTLSYVVVGTDSNGCTNSDTVIVNVNPLPTANAGPDLSVCYGSPVTLNATSNGSFTWNNGVVNNQSFIPSVGGNYVVTATNTFGCTKKDTMFLNLLTLPTVNGGTDKSICTGSTTYLFATGSATSYTWSGGITNGGNFTVNNTNNYIVTGIGSNGCSKKDTVLVTALPLPPVNGGPDKKVCTGSATTLTATGASSYSWNGGVLNGIPFTPTSSGNYVVTGVGANTCVAKDTVHITIVPLPNVSGGADQTLCSGTQTTLSATGASSYTWTGGVVNAQPFTAVTSQYYSVSGTDTNGCVNTAIVHITANPLPIINAGPDVSVCKGNYVSLNALSNANVSWNNGVINNFAFYPQISNGYVATATNSYGCKKTDTVVVTVNPLPIVNAGVDQTICSSTSTTLHATGASTYNWSNGVHDGIVFTPASTHQYTVTGTDSNGCINKDSVLVTLNPLPVVIVPGFKAICPGGNTSITASGAIHYLWSNGDTLATTNVVQPGNYSVIGKNSFGCADTVNTLVQIKAVPVSKILPSAVSACEGATIVLFLNPGINATGFNFQWYKNSVSIPGATSANYPATNNGDYQLSISGGNNCTNISSIYNIAFKVKPTATFSVLGNTTLCQGQTVTLNASLPSNYSFYSWQKDSVSFSGSPKLKVSDSGLYRLIVAKGGCYDTSQAVQVNVNLKPAASISVNNTTICSGDSTRLSATPQIAGYVYRWYLEQNQITGASDSIFYAKLNGNYKVVVSNSGCEGFSSKQKIVVNPTPTPFIAPMGSPIIAANGKLKLVANYVVAANYQWYYNGNIIAGATTRFYTATTGGNYTVNISKNNCSGTSPAFTIIQSNVREETALLNEGSFELSAYPNPVGDVLTVTLSGIEDVKGTLEMLDVLGKAVQCQIAMVNNSTFNIQTSTLSSGIYFIHYKDDAGRTGTLKVMKE
jgi:hypothetical protein